ncbi:hypothetical protein BDB01DRAFT_830537 [Pilobolus umbonatus]|nr:hypothetical protein BDB01DRAFT_830537 [Pilobolus umbonatus]
MSHPHSAIHIFQFLVNVYESNSGEYIMDEFIISLETPRFTPVSTLLERWSPTISSSMPHLLVGFQEIIHHAARSNEYDTLLRKVANHFRLIYNVYCLLENDLELELFMRCLHLDSTIGVNKEEIREDIRKFVNQLPEDAQLFVKQVLVNDKHGYLTQADIPTKGFLDLNRVYEIIGDQSVFDQFMAILQYNSTQQVGWANTMEELYMLLQPLNKWDAIAPLLDAIQPDPQEYASYEEYVQKNFLDDGGKEYLDGEIDRAQLEHMLGNLSM